MNKKQLMSKFIKEIEKNNLLTLFIKEIFDYKSLEDYNYIFRMIEEKNTIIIDIYDNVDGNHFNRYIFNFSKKDFEYKSIEKNNIVINYINICNITNQKNNLLKFSYLFKTTKNKIYSYAKSFMSAKLLVCLQNILDNKNESITL